MSGVFSFGLASVNSTTFSYRQISANILIKVAKYIPRAAKSYLKWSVK